MFWLADSAQLLTKLKQHKLLYDIYLQQKLNSNLINFSQDNALIDKLARLTESEKKILKLIGSNFSSIQIAEKLFTSQHTIKSHRKNIKQKLGLENEQNSLLKFAVKNNIYLN